MSALDQRVAAILADPLAAARDAERAIGFIGLEMPDDLLAASGRFPVHLPWSIDRATPRADAWLESSFPVAARSILEDWADGRFDFLEAVLFTRGEDSTQRLYYYVCELQRRGEIGGPEPLIFDVAKIARPSSLERTRNSLVKLADRFDVDGRALRDGIAATDRRRAFFADLVANRAGPGSRYERIARASLFAPLDHLDPGPPPADIAGARVVLAGSAPPDDRLHRAIEAAGANVVDELCDRSLERLGDPIGPEADPFAALAERAHQARLGPRSFVDRAEWLVARAQAASADAVILWLVAEEEALVWHVPAQRSALAEAGIPALVLANRRADGGDGADEEIAQFLGSLCK
jgi:hypothetical protein